MKTRFRLREPSRREELGAAAMALLAGLGSGVVAYYLTRLFLARERLGADD
ncbi:MAG: hypothetical protein R3253_00635 [Longimicrobiales bacterium]|nr:hypothetical protein [Longimicrobiales bacterium]